MSLADYVSRFQGSPLVAESNHLSTTMAYCFSLAGLGMIALLLPIGGMARAQKPVPHPDFVVARPVLNMYAKPTVESEVVSQSIYGTDVLSLEKQADWYNIRTADGYTGWVEAAGLKALDAAGYAPDDRAVRVTG